MKFGQRSLEGLNREYDEIEGVFQEKINSLKALTFGRWRGRELN